jgi:hypothetical protein
VILGQADKIASYALEKVLAHAQELAGLETAVHIQWALSCELPTFFITDQRSTQRSLHMQTLEEGTLVASTSHSAKVLNAGSGVTTVLTAHAMTHHRLPLNCRGGTCAHADHKPRGSRSDVNLHLVCVVARCLL